MVYSTALQAKEGSEMSSAFSVEPASSLSLPAWIGRLIWLTALLLIAAFVTHGALRFLVFTEASYGALWPNRHWLLLHFLGGSLALLAGITQFWTGLRRARPALHRLIGRSYLLGVTVGASSAFAMSFRAVLGWPFGVASFVMATAWCGATVLAYVAVRNGRIEVHREWMLRSFIVAFGFVTFRAMAASPLFAGLGPAPERLAVLMWLSWTVPLLAVEALLQRPRLRAQPSLLPTTPR
jgi:uncharacterized membrane protein